MTYTQYLSLKKKFETGPKEYITNPLKLVREIVKVSNPVLELDPRTVDTWLQNQSNEQTLEMELPPCSVKLDRDEILLYQHGLDPCRVQLDHDDVLRWNEDPEGGDGGRPARKRRKIFRMPHEVIIVKEKTLAEANAKYRKLDRMYNINKEPHSEVVLGLEMVKQLGLRHDKPFKCPRCDRSYKHRRSMLGHLYEKHDQKIRYRCAECDRGFHYWCHFNDHMKRHGKAEKRCKRCGNKFFNLGQLHHHQKSCVYGQREQCRLCGKIVSALYIRQHVIEEIANRSYQCDRCGQVMAHFPSFYGHLKVCHD